MYSLGKKNKCSRTPAEKCTSRFAGNVTGWRSADNSEPSRPATGVDYLVKVQVIVFCRLHSVCRNKRKNKEPKAEERFPSARIFANLPVVGRHSLSQF